MHYTLLRALAMRVFDGFGEGGRRGRSDLVCRRACSCMWTGMSDDFNRTLKLMASEASLMIEGLGLGVCMVWFFSLEPWSLMSFGSCCSSMVMECIREEGCFCINVKRVGRASQRQGVETSGWCLILWYYKAFSTFNFQLWLGKCVGHDNENFMHFLYH